MSDEAIPNVKTSEPAEEKERQHKAEEEENPKVHGNEMHEGYSEAGGAPGEGRTGTGRGSTDS